MVPRSTQHKESQSRSFLFNNDHAGSQYSGQKQSRSNSFMVGQDCDLSLSNAHQSFEELSQKKDRQSSGNLMDRILAKKSPGL